MSERAENHANQRSHELFTHTDAETRAVQEDEAIAVLDLQHDEAQALVDVQEDEAIALLDVRDDNPPEEG